MQQVKDFVTYIVLQKMSIFIKLTSVLINTIHINRIIIKPNKYQIYMTDRVTGIIFFGSGAISSHNDRIEICAIKHSIDYNIVSQWITNV